jgi:hypothetical protein
MCFYTKDGLKINQAPADYSAGAFNVVKPLNKKLEINNLQKIAK